MKVITESEIGKKAYFKFISGIELEGEIGGQPGCFFILHNNSSMKGISACDKKGYTYSYWIGDGTFSGISHFGIDEWGLIEPNIINKLTLNLNGKKVRVISFYKQHRKDTEGIIHFDNDTKDYYFLSNNHEWRADAITHKPYGYNYSYGLKYGIKNNDGFNGIMHIELLESDTTELVNNYEI